MLKPWTIIPNHEDLFIQRYDHILSWSLKITGHNRQLAEDLVHDAFIQFVLVRPDLSEINNLECYIYRMLRNMYLSQEERAEAPKLDQALNYVAEEMRAGHTDVFSLEHAAMDQLAQRGWKPDYISIRKRVDLQPPTGGDLAQGEPLVVLAAAKLGTTRLIDNLEI